LRQKNHLAPEKPPSNNRKNHSQRIECTIKNNNFIELLAKLQNPVLAAAECASALSLPSTNPRQPSSSVLVELLRSQQERIAVEKAQNAAKKAPTAGGRTVVQPLVAQAGTENKAVSELAAAVPPDALQVPLSDQEREYRATGLTPEQAKHAAEACVDTLEWLLRLLKH
jgi:hypothetical protein